MQEMQHAANFFRIPSNGKPELLFETRAFGMPKAMPEAQYSHDIRIRLNPVIHQIRTTHDSPHPEFSHEQFTPLRTVR